MSEIAVHNSPRRRFAAVVACLAVVALAATASSAAADSLTISVQTPVPEQGLPVTLSFAADTTFQAGGSLVQNAVGVEAVVRPAGGVACQDNSDDDSAAAGRANTGVDEGGVYRGPPGQFTDPGSYRPPAPGPYLICAWLETFTGNDTPNDTVLATATATFNARGPQVSVLAVAGPPSAQPGAGFELDYTTQTDQNLSLISAIKPAGSPCQASAELEHAQGLDAEQFPVDGANVFGGPTTTTATVTEQDAGAYIVCTWIEGPSDGEVDAATTTSVTVGTAVPPVPPARCVVPSFGARASLASVARSIAAAGCTVGEVGHSTNPTVPRGDVIAVAPGPGARLAPGAPVNVNVSTGPPCIVPAYVRGESLAVAERAIRAAHCAVGGTTHTRSGSVRRGRLIRLRPGSNTVDPTGSKVRLVVSSGR